MNKLYLFLFGLILITAIACGDDDNTENLIHYDGDNFSSPILPQGTHEAAVYFPADLLSDFSGREIKTIEYFVYDVPNSAEMIIYSDGGNNQPGNVLYQSNLGTIREFQWNFHVLPSNFEIDGSPIWISFKFENGAEQQTIGCDQGPRDARGGDWLYQSTDNLWSTFGQRTGESINWNIRAELAD